MIKQVNQQMLEANFRGFSGGWEAFTYEEKGS